MKKFWTGAIVVIVLILGLTAGNHKKPAATATQYKGSYVALGDSVAAGDGLKTDSDASACNRTNESYPFLVAKAQNYQLTSLACSGATLDAGVLGKQEVNKLMVTPQLDQLFAKPKPALITMTIGANDVGWTEFISKCYTATCGSDDDDTLVSQRLQTVLESLDDTLQRISDHYKGTPPRVVVTGYYQVFPTSVGTCNELKGLDESELVWGRKVQSMISDTVQQVANSYSFAHFAAADFTGHELCSADPWIQGLTDNAPYHPSAAGQKQLAKAVEGALHD